MGASHFFLGVSAGLAILTIPTAVFAPQLDLPQRVGAWLAGPTQGESAVRALTGNDAAGSSRPRRGFAAGEATPTPELQAPPTLQPRVTPQTAGASSASSSVVAAAAPQAVPTLPPAGLRTGVIRSGGGGAVYVRRVAGIQSPEDAMLPDGSPVLVSASSEIQVSGQTWRSVRGLNGVAGWVPSSMVSIDGQTAAPNANPRQPQPAGAPQDQQGERAVIANTDGEGVVLRRSARPDDRTSAGLREGTTVFVLEHGDADMAHVRADNGQEGWVPSQYLAPSA
jgi:SH3-like domain-containing protein